MRPYEFGVKNPNFCAQTLTVQAFGPSENMYALGLIKFFKAYCPLVRCANPTPAAIGYYASARRVSLM